MDGTTLQQSLGPWLHQYDQDFQWNWIVHPPTQDLYHWYGAQWHIYWPLRWTNNYIKYPTQPITHPHIPKNSQPATPTLHPGHIQLELPIPNQMIPPPVPEPPPPTFAQCLHTPPHKWARPLWHHILHHAPLGQLKQAIIQRHLILLVSNASVSMQQTRTCAWVIWSTMQLWSSEGIIPSTTNDLYSRLAKAYGIYTVLQFFQTYLSFFLIILPQLMTLKLYWSRSSWLPPTIPITTIPPWHNTRQLPGILWDTNGPAQPPPDQRPITPCHCTPRYKKTQTASHNSRAPQHRLRWMSIQTQWHHYWTTRSTPPHATHQLPTFANSSRYHHPTTPIQAAWCSHTQWIP